jgi:hypothetical protein
MSTLGHRILLFWKRHERYINFGGLTLGFLFDLWLAKRPDSVADNLLLVAYLLISGTVIVLLNKRTLRRQMEREHPTEPLLLLLILQFCFGGLANNLLILYGKSGTIGGSLFFILLLAAFALGNEFLKGSYEQLRFNVGIYYFLLLTYLIIAVPTFLLHAIGPQVFLMSCALSVICMGIFLYILFLTAFRRQEKRQMVEVGMVVGAVLVIFSGLYFFNIIPPVPLSLKQIGVYHHLVHTADGNYTASYEKPAWYVFWRDTSSVFDYSSGETAYCFSAVFGPGNLATPIVHSWEKYDPATSKWMVQSTYSFAINGGRANGYRGWSEKSLSPGAWRCDVLTARGQLIGRISFSAVESVPVVLSTTAL